MAYTTKIKNIIFDIGGVILNLDYTKTLKAFQELGVSNLDKSVYETPLFTDYEKGLISSQTFRTEASRQFDITVTDQQFDDAWNAMLLDLPLERLQIIQKLSERYRTFILSNTNAIHKVAFEAKIQCVSTLKSLDEITQKAYYSHQIHDRKPNASIFRTVLQENNLLPQETLYLEDTHQHIQTAESLGIQTLHIQPPQTMQEALKSCGIYGC